MELPELRELLGGAREIVDMKLRARAIEEKANAMTREYCLWLTTYGVPVRDIAELLCGDPNEAIASPTPITMRWGAVRG
jgi:hypothetical protein